MVFVFLYGLLLDSFCIVYGKTYLAKIVEKLGKIADRSCGLCDIIFLIGILVKCGGLNDG